MTLGDFGHPHNTGFDASHSKTVDAPSRFRNRTKNTPGSAPQTWSLDAPADPPKRKEGARFAARKADAGDVVARDAPKPEDQSRPLKQCRPRPATALVDDQKIGGHHTEGSPRRAGECFGRIGKKPTVASVQSVLNVNSPERQPAQNVQSGGRRAQDRSEYNSLHPGQGLPKEQPPPPVQAKNCSMSAQLRKSDPTFLHWPQN